MISALLATALGVAMLTWLLGWWGVVIAALVAGALLQRRGAAWLVALAAVVAWGALLAANALGGRFSALAASIGGVLRVPAAMLMVVTLLFGALLAWSAAVVGGEVGRLARAKRQST